MSCHTQPALTLRQRKCYEHRQKAKLFSIKLDNKWITPAYFQWRWAIVPGCDRATLGSRGESRRGRAGRRQSWSIRRAAASTLSLSRSGDCLRAEFRLPGAFRALHHLWLDTWAGSALRTEAAYAEVADDDALTSPRCSLCARRPRRTDCSQTGRSWVPSVEKKPRWRVADQRAQAQRHPSRAPRPMSEKGGYMTCARRTARSADCSSMISLAKFHGRIKT